MRTAKIHRKFLLALSVLAISLAALAPAARAAIPTGPFSFEAGAFAKAHPALTQAPPAVCITPFQCLFGDEGKAWIQEIEEAPEPTQAGGHPDVHLYFRFCDRAAAAGIDGEIVPGI